MTTQGGNEERCPTCLYEGGTYAGAQAFCRDPWHTTEQPAGGPSDSTINRVFENASPEAAEVVMRLRARIIFLEAERDEARQEAIDNAHLLKMMEKSRDNWRAASDAKMASIEELERRAQTAEVALRLSTTRTEQLEKALKFYADQRNYRARNNSFGAGTPQPAAVFGDGGSRARTALMPALSPDPTTPEGETE